MKNFDYIIDITKPPIGPPCRNIKDGFFVSYETNESIEQTERWKVYIEEYGEVLRRSRNEKI